MPTVARTHSLLLAVIAVASVALLAWWLSTGWAATADATNKTTADAVPVTVEIAVARDVPQAVSGIGTVEPLHAVTLRPQVDGVLAEVLFQEGQDVRRNELLARIDDRSYTAALMQAQAELARSQAQLKAAELDRARYDSLLGKNAISRQMAEQQVATVEQLQAAVRAGEAAVAAAQVQLSHTQIKSPIAGRVGMRRIDAGNLVRAGDTQGLVAVTQIDPISVVFSLPQELLPQIRPLLQGASEGHPAGVAVHERDAVTPLAQGRLSMIDNQVDPTTGMVRLRAEFANADTRLWPGQFVTVRLQTGLQRNALVVPARSVRQGLNGPFVYRVHEGQVQVVPVTPSYQDDDIAVIASGITAGDQIVTDGYSRLSANTPVRITSPAAAKAPASQATPDAG